MAFFWRETSIVEAGVDSPQERRYNDMFPFFPWAVVYLFNGYFTLKRRAPSSSLVVPRQNDNRIGDWKYLMDSNFSTQNSDSLSSEPSANIYFSILITHEVW